MDDRKQGGLESHRGRLQAQGPDITRDHDANGHGNVSRSWAQNTAYLATQGNEHLDEIEMELTSSQKKARKIAFLLAREFIHRAQQNGGVSNPVSISYPRERRSEPSGVRVDIEVIKGMAFV